MSTVSVCLIMICRNVCGDVQHDVHGNQIHSEGSKEQEQYYHYRQGQHQDYHQHYVPVPIQLLQRSLYNHQQPQAALIIVRAYPVYLSPNTNLHQNNVHQNIQYTYNPATRILSNPYGQETETRHITPQIRQHTNVQVTNSSPNLYYTQSANNNLDGTSYLNQLAQNIAQQYSKSPSTYSAPAIVTGLEKFSPDQQHQIKSYLNKYIDTHSTGSSQRDDSAEHREIMNTSEEEKYNAKLLSTARYDQSNDWRPAQQTIAAKLKNFGDKS